MDLKQQYQDYLTGILNRMGLFNSFETMDDSSYVNVLFFDLDNFKAINDVYGHKKGDEALITFADIVTAETPDHTIVARLGGDEFVAVIPDKASKESVAEIAEKILNRVRTLNDIDKAFGVLSCSVGIMLNYSVSSGLDNALSCADKAMYFAKKQGKDAYVFFDDYEEIIAYESTIEKDAVKALDEGRIIVKYHPVLHMQSSRLVATEACCMWIRPDGNIIGRNDFRSILVKNEYINEIDLYVFEQVCKDYASFKDYISEKQKVCIQFSHLLLLDEKKIKRLDDIMERYGVEASCFEINLDESMFGTRIEVAQIIESMKRLREKGFSLALSHFGEDFSGARYLKDLPITNIKLDGDFILENTKDEEGIKTLKSIIKLGKVFRYNIIACKIDDSERMIVLSDCGCDAATGDYFSKKLSLEEYVSLVQSFMNEDKSTISYRFKDNLSSDQSLIDGKIIGEDVVLTDGITKDWGAVRFPGGPSRSNYVRLPAGLYEENYTFSMWIHPSELQNWVSALYVRYQGGFLSFMPNISGGRCIYRVNEDAHMDVWHDALTKALDVGRWTYVAFTYDSFSSIARLYINGELEAVLSNVPNMGEPKEVWLGGDVFQNSFCGFVSALQISNVVLESDEIKQRYEEFVQDESFIGNEVGEETELTEIEVHDPAIFEDTESGRFYIYGTGAQSFTSRDLIHWKNLGIVVKETLPEAVAWTKSDAIWAPDIVKVGPEYRLYCSNSSWGVRQSCIFLAVADSPEGPFIPKAPVIKTENEGSVNAIDANIIEDHETKEQYMVYGSFWGGIHIIKLDKETGLAVEGQGVGKQIACRPAWNDTAIEGPYIIYHPETDYYYLFVSYGSLMSDYNIRVGRSKNVTGPYVDYNGQEMTNLEDASCSTGLMISCGYRYLTGQAYMGPGHNSVLLRENGEMYLVSHIRKLSFNADPGPGLLQIRKMIMTPDGWPIAMGQPYNAETLLEVRDDLLLGDYERIELRPSIPQGIQHAHPMRILPGGRLEMASVIGTWNRVGTYEMQLEYGPIKEFVHFEKGLDKEKNKTTVVMCGLTSDGICTWAKKESLDYI